MSENIVGRRIIVTGGAKGMAAAMVRDFAAHGAHVVSMDVDDDLGRQVAAEADAGEGSAAYLRCDVADEVSVGNAFDAAVAHLGGLDALIHAAGIAPGAAAEAITLDAWEQVFAVNTRGTFLANRAAFPHLKAKGGRVINFASGAGANGYPGKGHYAASKGAVLAWTRTIAKEWGQYGITANAIVPAISTPMYAKTRASMTAEQLAAHDADLARTIPIDGRLGDPVRDLAPVVRFLVSDGARFMTGQMIVVDGGLLMTR